MAQEEKKNYTTHILVILLVVASFALGSLYTRVKYLEKGTTNTSATTTQTQARQPSAAAEATLDQVKDAFNKSLVKFGDANKKLVLIEVADPSCPYCHIAAGKNPSLNKQVGDRFTLVSDGGSYVAPVPEFKKLIDSGKAAFAWLYTPGHGNGEMGTKALYCAFEKGKFWEVHDKLMTAEGYTFLNDTVKNDKTKSKEVAEFLKSVFNPSDMQKCLESGKYDNRLQEDISLATSLGVSGTPGFFINATKFAGAYSYTEMQSAVEGALK